MIHRSFTIWRPVSEYQMQGKFFSKKSQNYSYKILNWGSHTNMSVLSYFATGRHVTRISPCWILRITEWSITNISVCSKIRIIERQH